MTRIVVLEYPLETNAQISWLEELLMGLELGDFVKQQQILLGDHAGQRSATEICDTALGSLYQSGLIELSEAQRAELLHSPRALLQLQEKILEHGGKYWQNIKLPDDQQQEIHQAVQQVQENLTVSTKSLTPTTNRFGYRKIIYAIVSLAAMVLIALFLNRGPTDLAWSKPGVLDVQLADQAFKQHLAVTGQELLANLPADKSSLATRLRQTLTACDALLVAELKQLSPAVRQDLKTRCERWRAAFAQQLANLESNQKTVAETQAEFEALGQKMLTFLAS
jgi:hypothetical protein